MSLSANLTINIYSVMILLIIFIQTMKSTEKNLLQQKFFVWILLVTALMLVMDILSRFDGYPGTLYAAANQVGNFLIFLKPGITVALAAVYAQTGRRRNGDKTAMAVASARSERRKRGDAHIVPVLWLVLHNRG